MSKTESLPQSHRENNEKLVADGYVHLYEIKLRNGTFLYFKENNTVKWQGRIWTGIPLSFEGFATSTGDKLARPTLLIANPDGAFSTFIRDGLILRSEITRYSILYDDILNDRNIFHKKTWVAWNIPSLSRDSITMELRNPMDGVNFDVPARMYLPPEFPSVTL